MFGVTEFHLSTRNRSNTDASQTSREQDNTADNVRPALTHIRQTTLLSRAHNTYNRLTDRIREGSSRALQSLQAAISYVRGNENRAIDNQHHINNADSIPSLDISPINTPRESNIFSPPSLSPVNTPPGSPSASSARSHISLPASTTVNPLQQNLDTTASKVLHDMLLTDLRELLGLLRHFGVKEAALKPFENINWSGNSQEINEAIEKVKTCGQENLQGYHLRRFNQQIDDQQKIRAMCMAKITGITQQIHQLDNEVQQYSDYVVTAHQRQNRY